MVPPLSAMTGKAAFRPWGELDWALALSSPRKWRFIGCVAAEERSVASVTALHRIQALQSVEMLRILDPEPINLPAEDSLVQQRIAECTAEGLSFEPIVTSLDAPLQNSAWKQRMSFPPDTGFCLDISSLPKRFFFSAIKAALHNANVRDFLIIYAKPQNYPEGRLSSNPRDWSTITGFDCEDPDYQSEASSRLIVGAGFAVDGLHDHLEGRGSRMDVDVLIPFPADHWSSVRRTWESTREIAEALGADPDQGLPEVKPNYHRVAASDTSTAFDCLRGITDGGRTPAALAPLGPKPHSVAMCLLAAQTGRHPVYYAQPRTYALNYSFGCKTILAYWIKHKGVNLYSL